VRSLAEGTVAGGAVKVLRDADRLQIVIDGPGRIWESAGQPTAAPLTVETVAALGPPAIEFAQSLDARGRVLQKTTFDFTGAMTTREHRLLDEVRLAGRTTLRQKDTSLSADQVVVAFRTRESWRGVTQDMDTLTGTGGVLMLDPDDRLSCDRIEIAMGVGPGGRPVIRQATATGSVVAQQDDRMLQAGEKLIVDFKDETPELVQVSQTPDALPVAERAPRALAMGRSTAPQRLRAFGSVTVIDPSQSLELSCEQLDCTLSSANEIDTAALSGSPDRPSSFTLDTFSVTGRDIRLDVTNERADVPGPGRMTIQSQKDLDGRKGDRPIPIAVTWTDGMKFRENQAVFSGRIHARSEAATTFDCEDNLVVEFEDAPQPPRKSPGLWESWGLGKAMGSWLTGRRPVLDRPLRQFAKEPRYIEATGKAVAQTAENFPGGESLKSRARIAGPKLSLHLRSELSKMLIEGPGDLLLEDFQPESAAAAPRSVERADLFSDQSDAGPSKTVIQWRQRMSYDFGIDQTLFEGGVQLTHLSGAELEKVFGIPEGGTSSQSPGRRTFLTSDALTVDFTDSAHRPPPSSDSKRMGRISSDRLHRFRANGNVELREEVEQFSLNAEEITFERPRKILLIHGSPIRKAQLIRRQAGKLPDQMAAERIFFNLETGKIEISRPTLRTGP
jgi:hypothetical protein